MSFGIVSSFPLKKIFFNLHMTYFPCSTGEVESVQTKQGKNEHKTLNFIKHCVTGKD